MNEKMFVYGKLFTNGQIYSLLNPQPVVKDTCWNDGSYAFFVANSRGEATTIVTNSFVLEYASQPESMVVTRYVSEDDTMLMNKVATYLDMAHQAGDDFMDEDPDDWADQEDPADWVDQPDESEWVDDYNPDFGRQDREPFV